MEGMGARGEKDEEIEPFVDVLCLKTVSSFKFPQETKYRFGLLSTLLLCPTHSYFLEGDTMPGLGHIGIPCLYGLHCPELCFHK